MDYILNVVRFMVGQTELKVCAFLENVWGYQIVLCFTCLFSLGPVRCRTVGKDVQTLFCEMGLPKIRQHSPFLG